MMTPESLSREASPTPPGGGAPQAEITLHAAPTESELMPHIIGTTLEVKTSFPANASKYWI